MELVIAGIIARLAMDGFQRLLWLTIGQPPSNWAVVGRWAFTCCAQPGCISLILTPPRLARESCPLAGLRIMLSGSGMR